MSPPRATFPLFDAAHVTTLLAIPITGILWGLTLRKSASATAARVSCAILAVFLSLTWLSDHVFGPHGRPWSVREDLPLHLCDLGALACIVALAGQAVRTAPSAALGGASPRGFIQDCYELAYFWSLGGSTQALLTPDIAETFPSVSCLRFFGTHGAAVISALVMTIGLRLRPRPGAVARTWLRSAAAAAVVLPIDWALGANYMFLLGPPKQPSLYDHLGPWPWVLVSIAVLAAAILLLLYAPFWLADRRQRAATNAKDGFATVPPTLS